MQFSQWRPLIIQANKEGKGWGCGSSGELPAWQPLGPEFKPQYHQKNKKEKERRRIAKREKVCFLYLTNLHKFGLIFFTSIPLSTNDPGKRDYLPHRVLCGFNE
jgi:hypothetical protein